MKFSYWSIAAALAMLPAAAIAQQSQQVGPTDANAPVPEPGYVSVFENYRSASEDQVSPVEVWRAANEEVARSAPHAGHGKPMTMPSMGASPDAQKPGSAQPDPHAGHGTHMAAPRVNTATATPKATPSESDPHAGHGGQHNMQGK